MGLSLTKIPQAAIHQDHARQIPSAVSSDQRRQYAPSLPHEASFAPAPLCSSPTTERPVAVLFPPGVLRDNGARLRETSRQTRLPQCLPRWRARTQPSWPLHILDWSTATAAERSTG